MEAVDETDITSLVSDRWGLSLDGFRYFPEGGGAYHWIARTSDGERWFVTCDDLDTKPWLGSERDAVFDGLLAAYAAATDLRAAGMEFVAAPVPSASGAPAERIDARHSVSVFDYVEGEPGTWGRPIESAVRDQLVMMLARMHALTPTAGGLGRRGVEVAGRAGLESALDELGHAWNGGPLSEWARAEVAAHRDLIAQWLTELDHFASRLGDKPSDVVVTHGEPHPGNLIHTPTGLMLVDWDTVALARPERDLWMLADADGAVEAAYRELTGVTLDPAALAAYRLVWTLNDVAAFTEQLRGEHRDDEDGRRAVTALRSLFSGREPAPYGAR
jgi:spectinomycin phosphotransferase